MHGVKIQALNDALRFVTQVRSKPEDRNEDQRQGSKKDRDREKQDSDAPGLRRELGDLTDDKVDAAVRDFVEDSQAQANGLSASTVGHGHGLRVILKGADGVVVRQFTGEEFVRMREAVGKASGKAAPARGKILDQKL